MKYKLLLCICFLTLSFSALAKSSVEINAVNYPVWAERNQQLINLAPGVEVLQGDIVTTGKYGRAWLSMQDGSVVKLGQNTQFKITTAEFLQQQETSLLDATFNVIKGAFRFTSGFFKTKFESEHQVDIKVGAVTIGIRGTDIWGRSSESEDFVTLLDGSISIEAEGEATVTLNESLTAYRKLKDQPADPVTTVDISQVQMLGAETELSMDRGIASIKGEYDLILMSLKNNNYLKNIIENIRLAGYAVTTESIMIQEMKFTRIVLTNFIDRQSAENMSQQLQQELSLQDIWIRKN